MRSDDASVHRIEGEDAPRGAVAGVQMCGSIWACAVCSAHIRAERASEIAQAITAHEQAGGAMLFVVLTLRHHRGERLDVLLDGLQKSIQATFRGAPWKRMLRAMGIDGRIVTREVTWGDNGWHPHANLLLFLDGPLTRSQQLEFDRWLSDRWSSMVERRGLQQPDQMHGCRLEMVQNGHGVGRYVAKLQEAASVPLEMTWVEAKRSRGGGMLPFEILDAAGDGEAEALDLWWEYEAATRRRRCMTWTAGLRERLGVAAERDDEDIVMDNETSEETLLVTIGAEDWHAVCDAGLDYEVVKAAEHPLGREAAIEAIAVIVARARSEREQHRRRWLRKRTWR